MSLEVSKSRRQLIISQLVVWTTPAVEVVFLPAHAQTSLVTTQDVMRTWSVEHEKTFEHDQGVSKVVLELPNLAPSPDQELLSIKIIGQLISTIFSQEVQSDRSSATQVEGRSSVSIGVSLSDVQLGVIESNYEGRASVCPNKISVCSLRSSSSNLIEFELEELSLFSVDEPFRLQLEIINMSAFEPPMISVISQSGSQPDIVDPKITLGNTNSETAIYFRVEYGLRVSNQGSDLPAENIIGPSRVFSELGGSSTNCDSPDSGGSGSDITTGVANTLVSGG